MGAVAGPAPPVAVGSMRVLMFGWEFPPHRAGGLATATLGLVKGLLRNGVEVTLVVPFAVDDSPIPGLRLVGARDRTRGLTTIRVDSPLVGYATESSYALALDEAGGTSDAFAVYGRNLFDEVERFAAVAADIARAEPHDVIDCHDWITYASGVRAREASGRPLVAHLHATERDRSAEGSNAEIRRREAEGLAAADLIVCNSRWMRRQIIDDYGVDRDRVEVIPWGIDERDATPVGSAHSPFPARDPVVLFLGRVTRQKGPDYFVEVAGRVARFVPRARFVLAGTGDLLPRIIERAVELGLADRFHVAGPLAGPDVDRALRLASVVVMPSVSEPFGLVALESLRSGTPCIIPKESGVAEVVSNAFRADFWDVDRMTDQVVSILRHPPLRQELSERGLAEVRQSRFALDEPGRRTAEVYRRAMTLRGAAPCPTS